MKFVWPSICISCLLIIYRDDVFCQAGTLDKSFNNTGIVITGFSTHNDEAFAIAVQFDGKILVAGQSSDGVSTDFAVLRYNADGTLDRSFSVDGKLNIDFSGSNDGATSIAQLPNGNILVSGFATINGNVDFGVAQITSDGKLATVFSGDGKMTIDFNNSEDRSNAMVLDKNHFYLAGSAVVNGIEQFAVTKFFFDGTPDLTFDMDGKANIDIDSGEDKVRSIAIQSDSKIVLVGTTGFGFQTEFALARLSQNGMLDASFDGDGKLITRFGNDFESANAVIIQPDQKIVAAGHAYINTGNDFVMARYLSDGSLDSTFDSDGKVIRDIGTRYDEAYAVAIQSDGKLLLAGQSALPATDANFGLARFNTDGSLDKSFNKSGFIITPVGAGEVEDEAMAMTIQADGKILLAGYVDKSNIKDIAVARYLSGIVSANTSIEKVLLKLEVYPNPITSEFQLKFELINEETLSIYLTRCDGKIIHEYIHSKKFPKGLNELKLEIKKELPSNQYELVIQSNHSIAFLPLSKQ